MYGAATNKSLPWGGTRIRAYSALQVCRWDSNTWHPPAHKRVDKFDGIIIETTGLADPAPVIQTFFVDEDIQKKYKLDSWFAQHPTSTLNRIMVKYILYIKIFLFISFGFCRRLGQTALNWSSWEKYKIQLLSNKGVSFQPFYSQ